MLVPYLTTCLLLLGLLSGTTVEARRPHYGANKEQPNIILLTVDDMGWMDVGYHNPEVITPTIDSMAREGIILEHNYVAPVCSPTRSTILSGKYTHNTGEQHFVLSMSEPRCLDLNLKLLPQELKDLGYVTHALGKWHLGYCNSDCLPTSRGFDSFYGMYHGEGDHYTHVATQQQTGINGVDWHIDETHSNDSYGVYSTDAISDDAVSKIMNHDQSNPMFMYLAYQAPHSPSASPENYTDMYAHIADDDRRNYLGMVTHLDDGIKKVKDALEASGMAGNTLIVWMSDNGGRHRDGQYNYPLRGEKRGVFEGGTRTNAFVWGSGVLSKKANSYSGLMHASDWFPTLIKIAQGAPENIDGLDGVDNSLFLTKGEPSKRTELVYNLDVLEDPFQGAIRNSAGWKLIIGKTGSFGDKWEVPPELRGQYGLNEKEEIGETSANLRWYQYMFNKAWDRRLFNLRADPTETYNMFTRYPNIAEDLEKRLYKHFQRSVPPANVPYRHDLANPDNYGGYLSPGWC